jgi:hypothetical protein
MVLQTKVFLLKRTEPWNPQRNGKYERFRPTIEMASTEAEFDLAVVQYNGAPHYELPIVQRERAPTTPDERYSIGPIWNSMIPPSRTVDRISKPLL